MTLSNRLFTDWIEPKDDRIHSQKDEEWNQKLLQFLGEGRLEDVARASHAKSINRSGSRRSSTSKPMWWTAAIMGQSNNYNGEIYAYEALYGTGAAVISLTPTADGYGDKEYDEDDVEFFGGDRGVLSQGSASPTATRTNTTSVTDTSKQPSVAPKPAPNRKRHKSTQMQPPNLWAHTPTHAVKVSSYFYPVSVRVKREENQFRAAPSEMKTVSLSICDIEAQTRAVIENIRTILEAAGSSLNDVVDVTAFLVDMDRDFAGYNKVYREYFEPIQATRTTLAIRALPTPIAVEFKVVARPST